MRLALLGNGRPSSVLFSEDVDVQPSSGDYSAFDAVLLSDSVAIPAKEELAALLAAGKSIAVASGNAAGLDALRSVTGLSSAESAELLAYRQVLGSNPPQYSMSTLAKPALEAGGTVAPADEDGGDEADLPVAEPTAVPAAFFTAPTQSKLLHAESSLGPPPGLPGVRYGVESFQVPMSATLGKMWDCDRLMNERNKDQVASGQLSVKIHVYWADGELTPFYLLAVEQDYEFMPTLSGFTSERLWSWVGWSKGWFMHTIELRRMKLNVSGSGAQSDRVSLVSWGPKGYGTHGETFDVKFGATMRYSKDGGRQKYPMEFSSGTIQNNYPGWSNLDKSEASQRMTHWSYCQLNDWNSRVQVTGDFENWWSEIYRYHPDKSDFVHDFPQQSRDRFHVKTVSVYRIPCNSSVPPGEDAAPPPPVNVTLSGGLDVHMVGFHCCAGCTKGSHHMMPFGVMQGWNKTLPLDAICKP
jgi:hypothetical protein